MSRRGDGGEPVSLGDGMVMATTAKAILVSFFDSGEEHWFPRRFVCDEVGGDIESDSEEGAEGEVFVQRWIARDRGLAD